MKKLVLVSLCCVMGTMSTANASWFSNLFKKDAEPQTLSEACNTDEITAICPDVALGDQTLAGCLSDNIKSLSKKCAKYVKKSIKENKELILAQKDDATTATNEQVKTMKAAVAEKKAAVKTNAKVAGKEFKDAAKTVKTTAIETGKSVKEIVAE
ncbi:MAG: hypothetical protein IKZ49_03170 [Alphaproteobacteria bacterium]|nr:hypothetical protein [Alphaproteobacteria bacterium]